MKQHYKDILSRISEEPTWFDEVGTPRYGTFTPNQSPDIYAEEVALVLISCQGCGREFHVCFTWSMFDAVQEQQSLKAQIEADTIHYGDPPNVECCAAGPTMNSIPQRVVEFWRTDTKQWGWVRVPELEVEIGKDWREQ